MTTTAPPIAIGMPIEDTPPAPKVRRRRRRREGDGWVSYLFLAP